MARWFATADDVQDKGPRTGTARMAVALLDALTVRCAGSADAASIRLTAANALTEFVSWARRSARDGGAGAVQLLIRRLISLLHHPSTQSD